jgi:hypothetical protein
MTSSFTKRRQSSSYSDELSRYEFVDYTSVSNFEKFVTTIEETLYSWGIKDGSFGIFSTEQLENLGAAIRHPTAKEFTRREALVMGEETFQLTYHCHPYDNAAKQQEEKFPLAAEHFYHFGHVNYHPLHRWTGQDKLLILTPNNDSIKKKIFNPGGKSAVDVYQAKQLISACAIAFQNVGCGVPVFVPIGQSRHDMYMGYMLNSDTNDALNETEIRFNMSLTTPPTSQLSYLDGLKTLFLQKLCIHYEDYGNRIFRRLTYWVFIIFDLIIGKPGDMNENFWVSAVYTYNLKNWFDENWKTWDEEIKIVEEEKPVIKRKSSFSDDFESWGDDGDEDELVVAADDKRQKQQEKERILEEEHQLQFGSFNDPLRSLTLSALFPLSQDTLFDDAYQTNMDALTAKQWQISREFAPTNQQRAYLSTLLEQVIDSWVKDPTNREYLAPFDDSNDNSTSDSMSLMRNLFTINPNSLQSAGAIVSNEQQQQVNFFKSDQVDNVINSLFHSLVPTLKDDKDVSDNNSKGEEVLSTKKLGLRLKTGSSVPYRSFLWNLLLYSLEEASSIPDSHGNIGNKRQNVSNFLVFLKIIWMEVLRKIRWHWENLIPIPDLNPYLYDTTTKAEDFSNRALGIDLRYNIVSCVKKILVKGFGGGGITMLIYI